MALRTALMALCAALAASAVQAQQQPSDLGEAPQTALPLPVDDPFDYPEVVVGAEGGREMTVMSAMAADGPRPPLRVIVRFGRGADLDAAIRRIMSAPATQLVSTISGADAADAAAGGGTIGRLAGVREVKRLRGGGVRGVLLELPGSLHAGDAVAALKGMPEVEDVEQEGIVSVQVASADPAGGSSEVPPGLLRVGLARASGGGGGGIKVQATVSNATSVSVAVIDTGVDRRHPDINLVGGKDFTPDNDYGLDGNGHGTHVAGIAGARNNGAGMLGAVPGLPIWSLKVLSAAGQGTTTDVIDALNWVAERGRDVGIRVVNLSLSGPKSKLMCDAVRAVVAKGMTVIAAAGNNGLDIESGSPSDCIHALVVTAIADYDGRPGGLKERPSGPGAPSTRDDTPAAFSNYALVRSTRVVAAPGVHVLSTVPAARCGSLRCTRAGAYAYMSGTSMAAPLVSGMAALCYNAGQCTAPRASSAPTLYAAFYNANRADKAYGYEGDPNSPYPRKFYGYLAANAF